MDNERRKFDRGIDKRPDVQQLLENVRRDLPGLKKLLEDIDSHWIYEDGVYRFYHHSFKVYNLQPETKRIVAALRKLAPTRRALNALFMQIIRAGTGKVFELAHNERWIQETGPIVAAFFHARYFLDMAVRYGGSLEQPPQSLPSGWAAFLYLYGLRC